MTETIVIVGAGHGGLQCAASLREEGFQGKICLISADPNPPYQRPPLSKGFVGGKLEESNLWFRTPAFYENNQIDLMLGTYAAALDLDRQWVRLHTGERLQYDRLVLATGAQPRVLPLENADLACSLHTLAHARVIRSQLAEAERVTVIGGGFIGLEMAAAAAELGKQVVVLEAGDRLMARMTPPLLSDIFLKKHTEKGVDIRLGVKTSRIVASNGQIRCVALQNGEEIPTDLLVTGIGVAPDTSLAETAGLSCHDGIVVNAYLQTTHASVFAIGDCARFPSAFSNGQTLRLESVQNAVDQAKCVAATLCGRTAPYRALPWFWTHQYDLKLQMAGLSAGYDRYELRGDLDALKFSIDYYKKDRLIAVDSLNRAADHAQARKSLQEGLS